MCTAKICLCDVFARASFLNSDRSCWFQKNGEEKSTAMCVGTNQIGFVHSLFYVLVHVLTQLFSICNWYAYPQHARCMFGTRAAKRIGGSGRTCAQEILRYFTCSEVCSGGLGFFSCMHTVHTYLQVAIFI